MALSEGQMAFCRAWCEKHVTTWQVLRKGEWKYRWHGKTLVRYVDAVQMRTDEMSALIEYLASDACVETLSLAKQGIGGEWKPVNAWYERNEKPNAAIGGVRLYHALMIHPDDATGDGPYAIENGCIWKVDWTFYWKQQSVTALPASSSGVNYRITNLNRDDEDGTFSYVLERRERVQQDIAEYTREVTSFETRKEEQHLGVKAGNVAATGKAARTGGGTLVRRQLRKNEDCTTDVINETVTEKPVAQAVKEVSRSLRGKRTITVKRNQSAMPPMDGVEIGDRIRAEKTDGGLWNVTTENETATPAGTIGDECAKTVFEHRHSTRRNQAGGVSGDVSNAGNGKVERRTATRTENGTWDVEDATVSEQGVPESVTETEERLRGTVTTTVNRNQQDKADETGLAVGSSVRNEKTDGGLWNQTIRSFTAKAVGALRRICRATLFMEEDSATESVATDPGFQHQVVSIGSGKTLERVVDKNEAGGFDVTTTERKEMNVPNAVVVAEKTVDGVTVTTTERNAASAEPTTGLKIGESVRNEKTEGGLYNVVKSTVSAEGAGNTGESCQNTALEHRHSIVVNQGTDPGSVENAGGTGVVVSRRKQMTAKGGWNVEDETRTAKQASATMRGGTAARTVTVESVRNSTSFTGETGGTNVEVDVSGNVNEFGLVDGVKRTVTHRPATKTAQGGTATRTVNVESGINAASANSSAGGTNVEVDVSMSPNEHGSMSYTKRTVTHHPATVSANGGGVLVSEAVESGINATSVSSAAGKKGTVVEISASPNEHGSKSYTKRTRTAHPSMETKTWTTTDDIYIYNNTLTVFRNQNAVPNIPNDAYHCSVSISINEYGLLDGTIHSVTRQVPDGGSGGAVDYSGTWNVDLGNGNRIGIPFVYKKLAPGAEDSGFLDGAYNYPRFGLKSYFDGRQGIKFLKY